MPDLNKRWWSIAVTVDADAAEAIEFAFNEAGALGTEIHILGKHRAQTETLVTGYFDAAPDDAVLREHISNCLVIYGLNADRVKRIESHAVEDRDWLAEWKKHWKPTVIGRFVIAPPWEEVAATDKIVIRIEPNMAFGTGTHETTQLSLKAIGDEYNPNQNFLDVGTGTGILAIAAAKLATENTENTEKEDVKLSVDSVDSVAKILACDTDADSVKIARENAIANGVGELIEFRDGTIDDKTPVFDFVCANLTIDVIVPVLPLLIEKSGSTLLLSGILVEQEALITDALRTSEISNFKFEMAGEWISVIIDLS